MNEPARIALSRSGLPVGVLEIAGPQVRWTPARSAEGGRTARPDRAQLQLLEEEIEQLLHPLALEIIRAFGPLAVTMAGLAGAPAPLDVGSLSSEIFESAELILDVGALPAGSVSTIIDLATDPPELLREGAYSRDALRAIAPDLVLE